MAADPRAKVPLRAMNSELARGAAEAAQAKARELGHTISVAVVDESGNLVFFSRGDTCSFITFETAKGKAAMAAGFRRPTKDYVPHAREDAAFWTGVGERLGMIVGPGGYPITREGVLVGGIGCGGALGEEDHLCAEAGAKAASS
ncbi:MAG TPA: heme-binding protein [Stellaceae bacterium]|jgi:glc operon protein GlcG|nr:heme-binding protein [Stellaceae bacterium]